MKREIIEPCQTENLWVVTHNGVALVDAAHRDTAIGVAAGALLEVTANSEELELHGLTLSELLPARAADPAPTRLPSKIDFAEARRLAAEHSFAYYEAEVGTAIAIVVELCEEYEWGWGIRWQPIEAAKRSASAIKRPYFPITVDRVTGKVGHSGGTHGIELDVSSAGLQRDSVLRSGRST